MGPSQLLLLSLLIGVTLAQQVNRVTLQQTTDPATYHQHTTHSLCWLHIHNSHQLLDFRTNCPLNLTQQQAFKSMTQFLLPKKTYLFTEEGKDIHGYRYIKDPLNYYYQYYNFEAYHLTLA